ncbi:MAG: alpha-1,4-glucan--maltose-1-phosphate maltosyltransferase [Terriglobales bacterium]
MHHPAESQLPPSQAQCANPLIIENLWPELNAGRHPVKREVGDLFTVWADVFRDGHDVIAAALWFREFDAADGHQVVLQPIGNDRWSGSFPLQRVGRYRYTVEAWTERFESWRRDTLRKQAADQDLSSDLLEGRALLASYLPRTQGGDRAALSAILASLAGDAPSAAILLDDAPASLAARYPDPALKVRYAPELELVVDRVRARFSAWYEFFPRSQGTDPTRSATFRECEARLPEIQRMGFDVVYLPPIHPIGVTKRKGPDNSLVAGPDDPGSPYAIGSALGGHDAIEPGLGTLHDFEHFVAAAHQHGLEVALDFAINCSPDHPWVRQHPEWFFHRPDGSIKYAENPPKRYEDIYPLNFHGEGAAALWEELRRVLSFWIGHGVHIFRVDNPHTKPMPFWHWLLGRLKEECPEAIFLSEAFTRPKVMKYLAKIGFSQSYTYFTWRNTKAELIEYLNELAHGEAREYFRPNFFTNTPDILPELLQHGGRPAFQLRAVLAATLAPSYGIYSGFELCEASAVAGTEEYLHSEKYQYKVWDWERPGHIKDLMARLNQLRRENAALQRLETLRFLPANDDNILFYLKRTADGSNALLIAVNLDPHHPHEAAIELPLDELGIGEQEEYCVAEQLRGWDARWRGRHQRLRLDPQELPAAVLRVSRP